MRDSILQEQQCQNSGIGRNRTDTTPRIQPWSCAFRLPYLSIHGPFLSGRIFEIIEAVEIVIIEFFAWYIRVWYRRGIIAYMRFRARLHQTSFEQLSNVFLNILIASEVRGWMGPKFFGPFFTVSEKNPRKKLQPGKLAGQGIEPGPSRWEATMLLLDHIDGLYKYVYKILL